MPRLPLPAFALTLSTSLLACAGDDDGAAGPDGGDNPRAPRTTITARPDALTRQTATRFEFESDQAGSTFTCSLDLGPDEPCTSPFELVVGDAAHQFSVYATNADGLRDASPATHAWTVDTVPPVTLITLGPWQVDNAVQPRFEFSTQGNEESPTFTCQLDEGAPVPCVSPYYPEPISKGPHVMAVVATDAAGNVQVEPARHAWVADLVGPDTRIDTGPEGVVGARDATFTFSARNATAPWTFECRLDRQPWDAWTPCESPQMFTGLTEGPHRFEVRVLDGGGVVDGSPEVRGWHVDTRGPTVTITVSPAASTRDATPTFQWWTTSDAVATTCRLIHAGDPSPAFAMCESPYTSTALADGPARFELQARDAVGNVGTAAWDFAVDTIAPTVAITSGPPPVGTDPTPTFEFAVGNLPATVECRVGSGWAPCASPYTAPPLADASFVFEVRATDAAGGTATASHPFTVDTTAPVITITGGPIATSGPTADNTPSFTFTVTGAAAGGVECRGDNAEAYAPCASPYTTGVLADGSHVMSVRAVDAVGNARVANRGFVVDARPMTVTFTGGPTGETRDRSPLFTWTTTGAVRSTECRHDAGAIGGCGAVMSTDLADGPHTLEVRVRDDLGRFASGTISFTVDTVAPTATITGGPSGTISTTDVSFTFETGGAPSSTECRLFRQGQATGDYAPCASPHDMSLAPPSSPFPYTFEVRVRDAAGNVWSAYRNFTYAAP